MSSKGTVREGSLGQTLNRRSKHAIYQTSSRVWDNVDVVGTQISNARMVQLFGEGNLVVLQQRAPTPLGREEAFARSLTSWIKAAKFKQASQTPRKIIPCVQYDCPMQ